MRPEARIAHVSLGRHFLDRVFRRDIEERLEVEDDYGKGEVQFLSPLITASNDCSCVRPNMLSHSHWTASAGRSVRPQLMQRKIPLTPFSLVRTRQW